MLISITEQKRSYHKCGPWNSKTTRAGLETKGIKRNYLCILKKKKKNHYISTTFPKGFATELNKAFLT